MPFHGRLLGLALLLSLAPAAAALPEDPPKPAPWDVEDPGGPYRTFSMEATEGTWMSVDVSPDGRTLAFDLLGDVYTMPVAGGDAICVSAGLSFEHQPRWSPDGKRILFTSDRGGGDNLWTMDADGGNRSPLTKETFRLFNNGNWHPSGRWVVGKKHFTSRRSLGAGEMWILPFPEGGAGTQLTKRKNDQQDAGEPVLSPDGNSLYWSEDMSGGETFEYNKDPNGTIYRIRRLDMKSGEVADLVTLAGGAIRPQPSPDGRTLAFVRRVRNVSVLSLFDLGTGEVRALWDGLSIDQQETWAIFGPYPGYSWTPDGKALVIWAKGRLWRVDAATGAPTEIPFRAKVEQRLVATARIEHSVAGATFPVKVVRWPSVTPDGKRAVFQALGVLWVKDLPGGTPRRITAQGEEFEFAPRLAPDGGSVVYTTWNDVAGGRVKSVALDGSGGRTLVERPGHYLSAALSADGKDLVYHRGGPDGYRGRKWTEDPGIWRVRLDREEEPRLLSREGRDPEFSADGRRILVVGREGERSALVSLDRMGSGRRVLATSERAVDFSLSPDGRWIAFEELWQAWVAPVPPGPAPLVLSPGMKDPPAVRLSKDAGTYLSWSADSSTVRWSLGPDLFEARPAELFPPKEPAKDAKGRGVGAPPLSMGWEQDAPLPSTDVYLSGGTVLPMDDLSVIPAGVVHVVGDRIAAVGTAEEVPIPAGATVIDCTGMTVLPGLVDVHSHHGSSGGRILPRRNWALEAMLAFGVTAIHDPSNDTQMFHAEAELVKAGHRVGPRMLSTGTILYGAEGDFKAVVDSYEDAAEAVRRTVAWGGRSIKSYNQPRRDQRQQVQKACRDLGVLDFPEGGSTLPYNLTHILDGHTTVEHAIPVAPLYEPELRLFAESGTCYTPTLNVGYGGLWGENWWYAKTKVWEDAGLLRWVPRSVVDPKARRRVVASDPEEYHHVILSRTATDLLRAGVNVEIGAHGQMQGLGPHWETWSLAQGGMTNHEALRCATFGGARALCLEKELGALRAGRLADLFVVEGDPVKRIADSRNVRWTMVGGRLYDARTLEQVAPERVPLPEGPGLDAIDGDAAHAACGCGE